MTEIPEFSRPVSIARLGDGIAEYRFEAKPGELAAVQHRLGLLALDRLVLSARLSRDVSRGIRLDGRLEAALAQECVVSLEPVPATVDEEFAVVYRRTLPESEDLTDPEADDVELLEGDTIDLGEAATQQLALALDPFPRAPGAALPDGAGAEAAPGPGGGGAERPKPFAALGRLLKD